MGLFRGWFRGFSGEDPVSAFRQPSNRRELFFLVLRENLWKLLLLNLLYLLFCVPAAVWSFLHLARLESLLRGGASPAALLGTVYMAVLGLIPCLWLTALADAGIARVARSWARDEPALIWQDFWLGVRQNWKQALPAGVISSLCPLIVYWYAAFLALNPERMAASLAPGVVCALVLALWRMMRPTVFVMMVTYRLRLRDILKNSVIMTLVHLPTAIGVALAAAAPAAAGVLVLLYLSAPVGALALAVYFLAWGFSLPWLLGSAFANRLCEELINPKLGAPVRIGLRPDGKA